MFKLYLEKEEINIIKDLKKISKENENFFFAYNVIESINLNDLKFDKYENLYFLEKRDNIDKLYDFSTIIIESPEMRSSFSSLSKQCKSFNLDVEPCLSGIIQEVDNNLYN